MSQTEQPDRSKQPDQPSIDDDFSVRVAHPAPAQSPRAVNDDGIPQQPDDARQDSRPERGDSSDSGKP